LGSESEKEKDVGLGKEVIGEDDDDDDDDDDGDGGSESGDPSFSGVSILCKYLLTTLPFPFTSFFLFTFP